MTVPNLISQKVLLEDVAGDSMQRDAYLQEALSFSNDAMLKIQGIQVSGQPVLQRAFEVAEIMKEELEPRAISGEIQLSSQFTLDTLAALANDDWMNPQFKSSALGNAMRRRYSNQKSNLSHQIGQNVPSPHFFRDELGVYEGNLIEAITKWQGIEASAEDWLASIRIPTSVDSDLTFFLGVIWADGLNVDEEIDYKNLIKLSGRDKDHLFYNETLTPLVNSIFNKKVNILIPEKNYPILLLTSRAITTFVKGNFGFPSHKEKYGLPDFRVVMDEPIDEYGLTVLKQSFLTGIFAGMAKP